MPGDTVMLETIEASLAVPARAEPFNGPPLTGPIAIDGAEPGDTLVVEILEITPGTWAWTNCSRGSGTFGDLVDDPVVHYWDLRDGRTARFLPGIEVSIRPFCGVMGVAPAEPGRHSTALAYPSGGNMDIRHLTAGATLYLPVFVPGALFSLGDAHAAQGDGEICGSGVEMDATVTLRFDLIKHQCISRPRFRTNPAPMRDGSYFATTGHDADIKNAVREAVLGMVGWLEREHELNRAQALILASACVDLKISQTVATANWSLQTVSAFIPLGIFTD
jgi:acetamidase/formamidase